MACSLLTLAVQVRAGLAVGRMRLPIASGVHVAGGTVLGKRLLSDTRGRCGILRLVADGRELHGLSRPGIARVGAAVMGFGTAIGSIGGSLGPLAFLVGLALRVFLLLAGLPLFADFFEFCNVLAFILICLRLFFLLRVAINDVWLPCMSH